MGPKAMKNFKKFFILGKFYKKQKNLIKIIDNFQNDLPKDEKTTAKRI